MAVADLGLWEDLLGACQAAIDTCNTPLSTEAVQAGCAVSTGSTTAGITLVDRVIAIVILAVADLRSGLDFADTGSPYAHGAGL
jgi:hypothetical protein